MYLFLMAHVIYSRPFQILFTIAGGSPVAGYIGQVLASHDDVIIDSQLALITGKNWSQDSNLSCVVRANF